MISKVKRGSKIKAVRDLSKVHRMVRDGKKVGNRYFWGNHSTMSVRLAVVNVQRRIAGPGIAAASFLLNEYRRFPFAKHLCLPSTARLNGDGQFVLFFVFHTRPRQIAVLRNTSPRRPIEANVSRSRPGAVTWWIHRFVRPNPVGFSFLRACPIATVASGFSCKTAVL